MMNTLLDKILTVHEIYHSVQGESTWAGLPCVFVRLTGCHLRCRWCDTEHAFYGGDKRRVGEVVERVGEYGCPLVEITGGEPLLQKSCPALGQALLDAGHTVLIETSGALDIDLMPPGVIRIMDLKCPDSGEESRNLWSNIDRLRPDDEVKFVIASRRDYDWAAEVTRLHALDRRVRSVLFSPVFGDIDPRAMVEWILADRLPVRFQLQMHKQIWAPDERGV